MSAYETDEMDELLDGMESDEFDELAEQRGRRRSRGGYSQPRTAPGRGSYQPRPPTQDVTQTQLMATIARIEAQIKTNSEAITKVSARVNTVADQQAIHAMAFKKERRARMKADAEQKNTLVLISAASLFLQPTSREISVTEGSEEKIVKVLVAETDTFKSFVPIALALFGGQLGGLLGSGGLESSSSGSSGM